MKAVLPEVSFPKMEEEVLQEWESQKIFDAQNAWRQNAEEFAFYDGPPFANGLPHYGHLLANTIKDTVPRYWIMRGYKVNRRFGWDCHGLPVEFEIEKREQLKGRPDILRLGIDRFNDLCRDSVLHYAGEWRKTITRLGRWVDWDQQYRTMDRDFMESVWWVFKELYTKGLVYRGFKVVPYSPRTSSVVSNFEANQNYKDIQDPAVTVKFKLRGENRWILAWTTTPWTLPSNLALAVGSDITYVEVKDQASGEHWIVAEARLAALYPPKARKKDAPGASGDPYEVIAQFPGSALLGKRYEPLFPFFASQSPAFVIIEGRGVTTEDGTGVVHQAPAYGEDDYLACQEAGIELIDSIDDNGCFTELVPPYAGQYFKDADKDICRDLKEAGHLVRHDTLVHSYPFDERTDTPLMYKAVPSWYVAVEKFGQRLVANNQTINWVPEHIKNGRMGSWLVNARDWAISRNRFWGTPLPVWVCERDDSHLEVMGSVAELEERTQVTLPDIHLHHISGLHYPCPQCKGQMKPVNVVFDCWFESGSMPYAQLHYPFEQRERFAKIFPADFVAEGLDQTRGWFYTLNVLSNALFDKPAFKNVIVNGVILDESGKKMSKRHRNYTPPEELIGKYGADSVRLYMLNSPLLRAENLIFTDQGVKDVTRAVLLPLWNAYSFLATYAAADQWQPSPALAAGQTPELQHEMDRWIVSRLASLVNTVHQHMEDYKLYLVVPPVVSFIEDLTNWYIRLCRRRFWGDGATTKGSSAADQAAAYNTLYYVLLQFSKVLAPFAPFIAERLYQNLTDGCRDLPASVHLCDMPASDPSRQDNDLEARMDLLRRAANLGRSLRQKHKIKVRQVLPSMLVITRKAEDQLAIEQGAAILQSELNVKEILFTTDEAKHVHLSLKPNLRSLGRKLGKELGSLREHLAGLAHGEVSQLLAELEDQGQVTVLGHQLRDEDFLVERGPLDERLIATEKGVTVLLDTRLSPALIAEGHAREVVNRIQNLRKDSQLNVSDRIRLQVVAPARLAAAIEDYRDYILQETLGLSLDISRGSGECDLKHAQSYEIEGMTCVIALEAETQA